MTSPIIRIKSIKVEGRPCSINVIIPVGQGQAWIKGDRDKMLTLIDNTGKIIRYSHKICSDDSFIMDAVKYGNDILVIGYGEHKILRLRSDGSNTSVFYDAGTYITMGLSISPENYVVLSLKSKIDAIDDDTKVLIIASSGEVIKAIERDVLGNPVFDRPQRLVTTQTGKIIVVDNVTTPNKLVCVKQSGVIEFRRDIYLDGQAVTISRIVYKDKKLYATDKQSGKAFVMNEDGTGAKCLLYKEELTLPSAINFDIEGHLLVGCWEMTIHTFKFQQSETRELRKRKPKETIAEKAKEENKTPGGKRKRHQPTVKYKKRNRKESMTPAKRRNGKQTTEKDGERNRKESNPITFSKIKEYLNTLVCQEDEKARNIRIMLVGNEQVGKTSLCKNMLEEKLPEGGPERTHGIDIYIERFVIDMNTSSRKMIPEGEEHQNIIRKLNDCVQRQRSRTDTYLCTDEKGRTDSTNHKHINRDDNDQENHSIGPSSEKSNVDSSIQDAPEVVYTEDNNQNKMGDEEKPQNMSFEKSLGETHDAPEKSAGEEVPVPEGMYDELHHVFTQREEDGPHDKCYASFWDFSGEKDYYNTHHIFLTSDAVYLLVFKLSDCADSEDWLDRIIFWLRSIAAYAVDNAADKPNVGPPIILIGTHLDQIEGTDKEKSVTIRKMYSKLLMNETARKVINNHVRGFYQVSNIRNIKQVVENIWENILTSAPLQSQWERKLPCWWLERERVLMKRKASNVKMQTFAEVRQITKQLPEQLNTDQDVQMFLRYMHLTGEIIVTNIDRPEEAIIIIDPQWLAHAFRELITSPKTELPFCGWRFEVIWPIYEKTAVLPMELIDLAWERDKKGGFIKYKEKLLSVMEDFGLVARALWGDDEVEEGCCQMEGKNVEYIVPCMLPEATPNTLRDVLNMENVVKTCTLCFVFENGLMQFSVFDKIIACCIQRLEPFTDDLSNKMKFVQRGFVCLHLTCKWKVVICCKYEVMKVTLFKFSRSKGVEAGAGYRIRELLEQLLENVWKSAHDLHETQLEFQFEFHNNYEVQEKERRIKANDLRQTIDSLSFDGNEEELTGLDYDVWFLDRTDKSQVPTIEDEEIVNKGISADILDDRVTERAIADISKCIGNNFYLLFAELGIPITERDQILFDNKFPNFQAKNEKLLHMWYSAKGEAASYRSLYQPLLKHGINLQKREANKDKNSIRSEKQRSHPFQEFKSDDRVEEVVVKKGRICKDALYGTKSMNTSSEGKGHVSQLPDTKNIIAMCHAFKQYMDTHYKYKLCEVWPGYVNTFDGKGMSKKERIVAICNDLQFPMFYTFQEKKIIWREKNRVSKEAVENMHHEDVEITSSYILDPEKIQELFSSHRNLTMIHLSSFKSKGFSSATPSILPQVCVALYCRLKGVIPIDEELFPQQIQGFQTDVREGYFSFGVNEKLKSGSAITCKETNLQGTVGPFYEENGKLHFITCAHLAAKITELRTLKHTGFISTRHVPIYDGVAVTQVGTVKRLCFSYGDSAKVSIDAALVETNGTFVSKDGSPLCDKYSQLRDAGYGTCPRFRVNEIADIDQSNRRNQILKFGAESGLTTGMLLLDALHVKEDSETLSLEAYNRSGQVEEKQGFAIYKQYAVAGPSQKAFFMAGDSGSLCGIVSNSDDKSLKPFGLAIGSTSFNCCVVTPLKDVFEGLGLDVTKGITIFEPQSGNNNSNPPPSHESPQALLMLGEMMKMMKDNSSESKSRFDHIDMELLYTQRKVESVSKEQNNLAKGQKELEKDMESVKMVVFSPENDATHPGTDEPKENKQGKL